MRYGAVVFLPELQERQLAVDHGPEGAAPQGQMLGAGRPGSTRPGRAITASGWAGHPVGQIAEGVGGELDVGVQDEVIIARQARAGWCCGRCRSRRSPSGSAPPPAGPVQGAQQRRSGTAGFQPVHRCRRGWRCPPDRGSAGGGGCIAAPSAPPGGLRRSRYKQRCKQRVPSFMLLVLWLRPFRHAKGSPIRQQ